MGRLFSLLILAFAISHNVQGQTDSLRLITSLDSVKLSIHARIDSLNRIDTLNNEILARRDSLLKRLEEKKALLLDSSLVKGQNKVEELIGGTKNYFDSLTNNVLPEPTKGLLNKVDGDVPEININDKLPQLSIPKLDQMDNYRNGVNIPKIPTDKIDQSSSKIKSRVAASNEYRDLLDSLRSIDKEDIDTAINYYSEMGAEKLESSLLEREELASLEGDAGLKQAYFEELPMSNEEVDKALQQKMDLKKIQKDFSIDKEKLNEGVEKINKLKKKYSSLLDSRDLSLGVKKNSLKDKLFKERWELGLDGNLASFNPFNLLASPYAGFRVEKRWSFGTGLLLRGKKDSNEDFNISWSGVRVYSLFRIKKNFFGFAEYQNQKDGRYENADDQIREHLLLAGIGTEFPVFGSFWLRSTVKYAVNKKKIINQEFESPWQATIGIVRFKK